MAFNQNTLLSERQAIVGHYATQSTAASTVTSSYANLALYGRVQVLVEVTTLGASATVDASILQATDSSGTGAKALSPAKAITQITTATSGAGKYAIINVRAEELDIANGFNFVAVQITVGTAASVVGALILGGDPRLDSAHLNQEAAVAQIVN